MKLYNIIDSELISREYFTKETVSEELIKIDVNSFSAIDLAGNIGKNNYIYVKESDLSHFQSLKKKNLSLHNWEKAPLDNTRIIILSRTGTIQIRTRSSNGIVILGNNFRGSAEIRIINNNSLLLIGDDVTAHGIRFQVHGNGIYVGRRCLVSEEVIVQGHDAHAIVNLDNNEVINMGDKITKIQPYVWLGRRVTIMPGTNIGKGSVIGATSTVTKEIPPFSLAVGVPAKVIKSNISWSRTRDEFDDKSKKAIEQIKNMNEENKFFKK